MLAKVLSTLQGAAAIAARAVEARARRRRSVAADHDAARPRHRHRVRRHLLRDAVLGGRLVAAAAARGEPGGESDSRLQHRAVGRVVPAPPRARALVQAVPGRGDLPRRRQRRSIGVVAPILWEKLDAVSAEAPAGLPRSRHRSARLAGYHVIQSQIAIGSGGWFGKGYHAGHAEAARVPSRAAHRLHLRRRRRGARLHRRDASRSRSSCCSSCA